VAGSWTGAGVTSAFVNGNSVGIGYGEAAQLGIDTFYGQQLDGPAVVARLAFFGDANLDDAVNATDLGVLSANWQGLDRIFSQADFNYDGRVDVNDLYLQANNWGQTLAVPPPAAAQPVSLQSSTPRRSGTRMVSVVDASSA
jgi:hypothetical protein